MIYILRFISFSIILNFYTPCLLAKEEKVLRVGFFPNVTHAQAIVGLARGDFQRHLGEDVKIRTKLFNAGPSVIEGMFAGSIDLAYLGPSPVVNGYIRSNGEVIRVIGGATSGGVSFVLREGVEINTPKDLEGKTLASPMIGNTQDISLRIYLKRAGLETAERGGKVKVLPVRPSDIIRLFLKKQIHGAWVPEPWSARLVHETGGKIFLDEMDLWPHTGGFASTLIVATAEVLREQQGLIEKWLRAHIEVTQWIKSHPKEAKEIINSEIKRITTRPLPQAVLDDAFGRVEFTYDPFVESIQTFANYGYELGYYKKMLDLTGLYNLDPLNKVLTEGGLRSISLIGVDEEID